MTSYAGMPLVVSFVELYKFDNSLPPLLYLCPCLATILCFVLQLLILPPQVVMSITHSVAEPTRWVRLSLMVPTIHTFDQLIVALYADRRV